MAAGREEIPAASYNGTMCVKRPHSMEKVRRTRSKGCCGGRRVPQRRGRALGDLVAAVAAEVGDVAARTGLTVRQLVAEWVRTADPPVATRRALADYAPDHRAYVAAQNFMSVLSEQLTGLRAMRPLARVLRAADNRYAPRWWRLNIAITKSFFTHWAMFDAATHPGGETVGTCVLAMAAALGLNTRIRDTVTRLQNSYMGLYELQGRHDDCVRLRNLATGVVVRAFDPVAYGGPPGEIWYARVLPPPLPGSERHVVITTPYVLTGVEMAEAERCIARGGEACASAGEGAQSRTEAALAFLKYGPTPTYWLRYVNRAFREARYNVVLLQGLPLIPQRPSAGLRGPRAHAQAP